MKFVLSCFAVMFIAFEPTVPAKKSLWGELVEVTINHIKTHGPDNEVAEFVSAARHHGWSRRQEFVHLVAPYLKSENPSIVAGAIAVLYRFRTYGPGHYLGNFETDNHEFFAKVDRIVYAQLEYFHSLKSDEVYHSLALYLGRSPTDEAKHHLMRIAESPVAKNSKEQALICLAWHRDPNDMQVLLPYMMEDSRAARSLPYHFRNSYGQASIPYLKKTLSQAESDTARLEAAFQLVHLRNSAGFQYIHDAALRNPEPEGKRPRHLDRIKQFARDYLGLPKDVSSADKIAIHIKKKQSELCKSEV